MRCSRYRRELRLRSGTIIIGVMAVATRVYGCVRNWIRSGAVISHASGRRGPTGACRLVRLMLAPASAKDPKALLFPRLSLNGEYQQARYLKVLMSGTATAHFNGFRRVSAA